MAILMATYNGACFLGEQLNSIARQQYGQWTLFVSDDGSQDDTLAIVSEAQNSWGGGRVKWVHGPGRGFVANFLSLACNSEINANFYAWSDQDDIWCVDKLEVAIAWLNTIPEHIPALYCGRTELICESGSYAGNSPLFSRAPHFANALVQNIGGGNTMVFNQAARALLKEAGGDVDVPSHDWWAYQLISGAGGVVYYDPCPKVLYRQHGGNLVGTNTGWAARWSRMRMVFRGRFAEWNQRTIIALESMHHRLSPEHKITLERFKGARNQTLLFRAINILRAGIYRQTLLGNLGLVVAVVLKKI
ncbi:glycosyltransferase family 2 protein [Pseudomonas protegens]|uniref:glycosyltransferase family 2 protein n=1 Tax=Pseudomonas TaxID=286 RepID=UPI0032085F0C